MTTPHLDPTRRHDVVVLFDVTDGNPNGDPDAGNQPRTDDETGQGLVTDVSLKRKIRDTVPLLHPDDPRYGIFVEAGHALNTRIDAAKQQHPGKVDDAQRWLCENYYDIRMFGAVLSTGEHGGAGQVRGPVQLTFGRSIHPVIPVDHTITRVTQTRQQDIDEGQTTEMGEKWTVPYGLYRANLYFSASRAAKTGVTSDDLETLWRSLINMFDHDRSAARGELKICGLHIYSHPDALGVAPAASLTTRIRLDRDETDKPPRHYTDYRLTVANDDLPEGIDYTSVVNLWP